MRTRQDVAVPVDRNVTQKEAEKKLIYKILCTRIVIQRMFVCLFSWRYNPLWLYFPQPGGGL